MAHEYPIEIVPNPSQAPQPQTPEPEKKGWLKRRPYLSMVLGASAFLLIGFMIMMVKLGVSASQGGNTWIGENSVFFTAGRNLQEAARQTAEQVIKQKSPDTELGYIPIAVPQTGVEDDSNAGDGLASILASLTAGAQSTSTLEAVAVGSAFSFIPQGLISVSDASTAKRTALQDTLYSYGNAVGSYVQGFDDLHRGTSQLLKDHAEDRDSADKANLVSQLGFDMALLGRDMLQMPEIPKEAAVIHKAYATTYRIVGTNLTKVAEAKDDEMFLNAINEYNASVDDLTKRFLAVVALFSAHSVTFSTSDPGSIFMFNQTISF